MVSEELPLKRIVISNIKMPVRHSEDEAVCAAVKRASELGARVIDPVIVKKSVDARKRNEIHFVYSFSFVCENIDKIRERDGLHICTEESEFTPKSLLNGKKRDKKEKIIIAGSGPCGLFAALTLSECGMEPTIIERGDNVDVRHEKISRFWNGGALDPNTNVQFGEGGAGTFSDGKLNSRIGDPLQKYILKTFVRYGAPKEILYQSKPHIGTDLLRGCVKNIRNAIIKNGGTVRFNSCLTDIFVKDGKIEEIEVNGSERLECDRLIAALGHSSRDTYEMLNRRGVAMMQKPFAAGVRIEHTREFINHAQYGAAAARDAEFLPTADYRLAYNGESRSCYSFCMCPGGVVVNASSEPEQLTVNGMSYHSRMERNSNSALAVTVRPEDFGGDSPLAGVEFQRKYESLAYRAACGKAPVQLARDFLNNKCSSGFDGVYPSFTGETEFAELRGCLPGFIADTLCDGLKYFDRKINGFSSGGAVLTGIEMRTSAPVRIIRDEGFESIKVKGLIPAGEGAGYAGGIMSAAVDGVKAAAALLRGV